MEIQDITFLIIIGIACLASTACVLVWRGVVWVSLLSGVFWFMFGGFFMLRNQEGVVIMEFQEYLGMLLIGISFAMTFSFAWLKAKNMDLEKNAPQDIDIFGDDVKEYNRKRIDSMKDDREVRSWRRKRE